MNTRDTAKVREKLEQTALFTYCAKLVNSTLRRIVLFPIFPYTAAANLSDPRPLVMIDDLSNLTNLNGGEFLN
jgi:hypothetical protein